MLKNNKQHKKIKQGHLFSPSGQEGFTLLEIIIAMFVFFIGIMGIFSLLTATMRNTKGVVDSFKASQLAGEGLELVRNIRDKNWLFYQDWRAGLQGCTLGCEMDYNDTGLSSWQNRSLKIDSNGFYNYETGNNSLFKRKITISQVGAALKVKSEVFWQSETFTAIDTLYDWYNQ
ncbi:MAG: prepilin-type N-terminal cleavage/methylation domain-containing protein [bacterium]|nr:prepilin-type N-terminal cleavage/methylation domain-containing protein [bacterium]